MKPDIHPEYRDVVFQDTSSDLQFITRSTIATSETIEVDGETYPLAKVEISSQSHPFYTGKQILVDSGGRVERFRKRYAKKASAAKPTAPAAPAASEPVATETASAEQPAEADAAEADA